MQKLEQLFKCLSLQHMKSELIEFAGEKAERNGINYLAECPERYQKLIVLFMEVLTFKKVIPKELPEL